MKRILKIVGIVLLVIIVFGIIGGVTINVRGIPTYEKGNIEYKHQSSPEIPERGEKLTLTLCAGCHADLETGKLTGKLMLDAPPEFGFIYTPNITADRKHGIGEWTDGELVYLLRTGIKRDGTYAPPWMAKLPHLADEDMNAIIAFLRSGNPTVAADPKPDMPCEPSFLSKFLSNIAFKPLPYPEEKIKFPDTSNTIELGRYYAVNLECFSCHSADFKSNDYLSPEKSIGYFAGGNQPRDLQGNIVTTPNITPDKETGIGNWSKKEFINAVKYGQSRKGPALRYPMLPYIRMSDKEIGAIYEYLMTIPPIKNTVERKV